ncbi:MAG: hypothetical protein JNK87_09430 [Bryobacterales bacterium]|nr:hypothetical protein [Bryobacterales bacterium]
MAFRAGQSEELLIGRGGADFIALGGPGLVDQPCQQATNLHGGHTVIGWGGHCGPGYPCRIYVVPASGGAVRQVTNGGRGTGGRDGRQFLS